MMRLLGRRKSSTVSSRGRHEADDADSATPKKTKATHAAQKVHWNHTPFDDILLSGCSISNFSLQGDNAEFNCAETPHSFVDTVVVPSEFSQADTHGLDLSQHSHRCILIASNDPSRCSDAGQHCSLLPTGRTETTGTASNSPRESDARLTLATKRQVSSSSVSVSTNSTLIGSTFVTAMPDTLSKVYSFTRPALNSYAKVATIAESLLPTCLSCPSTDSAILTKFQVFLRLHIEVFAASSDDVESRRRGRTKSIRLNQVGIRCRHCAHISLSKRRCGSAYFPLSTMGFYQAAQNMNSMHLQRGLCPEMARSITAQFMWYQDEKTAGLNSMCGRQYWSERALEIGLKNTDIGVFSNNACFTDE